MKRFQLFEFEDLDWFPALFRDLMTDFLRTVIEKFGLFKPSLPLLLSLLRESGQDRVVDLASGGGGGWRTLLPTLIESHPNLSLTLTDLYPNETAMKGIAEDFARNVKYCAEPIDARDVSKELRGVRTMFLSLHHLTRADAVSVLRNAVESGMPIAVFEAQQRDLSHLIRFMLSPIMVLLITPFIRPFRLSRLFWTYLVPILPVLVGWDGVVSVLRTYSCDEMVSMANEADSSNEFEWTCDTLATGPSRMPYLIGRPQ